jgi:hypothetical protein
MQLRAELFNVLNRANFASPTDHSTVFDQSGNPISNAGLITSTQTTSKTSVQQGLVDDVNDIRREHEPEQNNEGNRGHEVFPEELPFMCACGASWRAVAVQNRPTMQRVLHLEGTAERDAHVVSVK